MDAHDTFLVLTFAGETRVLGMNAGAVKRSGWGSQVAALRALP